MLCFNLLSLVHPYTASDGLPATPSPRPQCTWRMTDPLGESGASVIVCHPGKQRVPGTAQSVSVCCLGCVCSLESAVTPDGCREVIPGPVPALVLAAPHVLSGGPWGRGAQEHWDSVRHLVQGQVGTAPGRRSVATAPFGFLLSGDLEGAALGPWALAFLHLPSTLVVSPAVPASAWPPLYSSPGIPVCLSLSLLPPL